MGNLVKAILNERDDGLWCLDSIDETLDLIHNQLMKVASEGVKTALLNDDDSSAYIGIRPELGDGIYLSVFVDRYVLYFDFDCLFNPEDADRSEVEKMSKWFLESHKRMEQSLIADFRKKDL